MGRNKRQFMQKLTETASGSVVHSGHAVALEIPFDQEVLVKRIVLNVNWQGASSSASSSDAMVATIVQADTQGTITASDASDVNRLVKRRAGGTQKVIIYDETTQMRKYAKSSVGVILNNLDLFNDATYTASLDLHYLEV